MMGVDVEGRLKEIAGARATNLNEVVRFVGALIDEEDEYTVSWALNALEYSLQEAQEADNGAAAEFAHYMQPDVEADEERLRSAFYQILQSAACRLGSYLIMEQFLTTRLASGLGVPDGHRHDENDEDSEPET